MIDLSAQVRGSSVERRTLDRLVASGFRRIQPDGLISALFPDTFVPSAFHERIIGATSGACTNGEEAGVEWVFRHVDLERVGASPLHLSAFRMLVFYSARHPSSHDVQTQASIATFMHTMAHWGISPGDLAVTYFGGGRVCGVDLPPDHASEAAWRSYGVTGTRLVPIRGTANFTNIQRADEPAGPRSEVYWMGFEDTPIEIGTVVSERYMLTPSNVMVQAPCCVAGGAIGIERLMLALTGNVDLFLIPELRPLMEVIERHVAAPLLHLQSPASRRLCDSLRSLAVITGTPSWSDNARRRGRVTKLLGTCRRAAADLGLESVSKISEEVLTLMSTNDLLHEAAEQRPRADHDEELSSLLS